MRVVDELIAITGYEAARDRYTTATLTSETASTTTSEEERA
jgi:hypothetical protein